MFLSLFEKQVVVVCVYLCLCVCVVSVPFCGCVLCFSLCMCQCSSVVVWFFSRVGVSVCTSVRVAWRLGFLILVGRCELPWAVRLIRYVLL